MRHYEIESIEAGSVFRLYFLMGLILGLVISLILVFIGASLNSIGYQLGIEGLRHTGSLQIGAIILGSIFGSVVYGLVLGIFGTFGALLYNGFARLAGGIVIRVSEKDELRL